MEEAQAKLKRVLTQDSKVSEEVSNYVLVTLKCESISDFAGLFDETDYRDQRKTMILAKIPSAAKTSSSSAGSEQHGKFAELTSLLP